MLALSTTRCGVVRLFTNRSKRLRFSSAQPNPTHWKSHARNLSHVSIRQKISATLH